MNRGTFIGMGGTYHGLEAVTAHVSQGRSTWAEGSCEPERFIGVVDKSIVLIRVRVRLKDQTQLVHGTPSTGWCGGSARRPVWPSFETGVY